MLAGAAMLLIAGTGAPAWAQDADADDFMRLQESLSDSQTIDAPIDAPIGAPDHDEAADATGNDGFNPFALVNPAPSPDVAPAGRPSANQQETADDDTGRRDTDPGLTVGAPVPASFLLEISERQREIALKKLELEQNRLQAEIDKLTGAANAREAALDPSLSGSPQSFQSQPQDDPTTLPGVAAVFGANGQMMAELALAGGGTLTAKPGDMLPGGWTLSRIDGSAVYVESARTGDEYVLGSDSAADQASRTSWEPAPSQPAPQEEASSATIILAPAN